MAQDAGLTLAQLIGRLQERYDKDIDAKILNIYVSGSRVYGTANAASDWDYIIVTNQRTTNCFADNDGEKFTPDLPFPPSNNLDVYEDPDMNFDVSFITLDHFIILLHEHRLSVLECLYLPKQFVLLERMQFPAGLDVDILRKTVSWEASLKFDHAKRRLAEGKPYKAQKLIWLAIRYLIFAIQLLDKGRIDDFQAANALWTKISQPELKDWTYVEEHLRPIFKVYDSKFKLMRDFNDFYSKDDLQSSTCLALHMHTQTNTPPKSQEKKGRERGGLAVVDYLREHGLQRLVTDYTVMACRHRQYPNLVQLSSTTYTLLDEVGLEAKGLIVDENEDWKVVAYSHGPALHAIGDAHKDVDWASVKVCEKLDGALAILYHYAGEWHVATARIPDADEAVCWKSLSGEVPPKQTFKRKFWDVWNAQGYGLPKETDKCYLFGLVSDDFRRIVRYGPPRIILHGVRDLATYREEDPASAASEYGWECVQMFPHLSTHEDVLAASNALNPWQQAGFLVRDSSGRCIKYLSPQYMAFFFAMGWQNKGFGPLNLGGENFDFDCLIEVQRFGAERTFLHFFPKWADLMSKAAQEYDEFVAYFDAYYGQIRDVHDQRELAQRVKALALPNKTWPAILFEMKKEGVASSRQFFAFIPRTRFLKLWKSQRDLAQGKK